MSDDEDVVVEEQRMALEAEVQQKGKEKVEEPKTLPNLHERGMREVDDKGSGSNSEDDVDVLAAKIDTTIVALREATTKVDELHKIKNNNLSIPSSVTIVHGLREKLKEVMNAISNNENYVVTLKKSRDYYRKKKEEGCVHKMNKCALYQ
jgi:hypothetical protein